MTNILEALNMQYFSNAGEDPNMIIFENSWVSVHILLKI